MVYEICSFGDNFYTNLYKFIKIISNYRSLARQAVEKNYPYQLKQARDST